MTVVNESYAARRERIEPIAGELERIAYRLRQGAISEELAAKKLGHLIEALKA